MKRRKICLASAAFGAMLACGLNAAALDPNAPGNVLRPDQEALMKKSRSSAEQQAKKDALAGKGVISGSMSGGAAGMAMEGPWGGTDIEGSKASPISGSVGRGAERDWVARVVNNSEDTYRANMAVKQYDERGRVIKTDNFSVSLGPKTSTERTFRAHPTALNSDLELKSWKRFPKEKSKAELQQEVDAKKKELSALEQEMNTSGN